MWWLVITAWRKDYWVLTASTQLISDMMKGDSLNQLIAPPTLKRKKVNME